jgi:glycosyltransferase involved in cell wall biosynthesis
MTMGPRFSFLVTGRNAEPYVRQCLDSILSQTIPDWECLIADDVSTDDTPSILDTYASKDHRLRVFHQPDRRYQLVNLLYLIQRAHGSIMVNVSLDDYLPGPDVLRILTDVYSDPLVDSTYGSCISVFDVDGSVFSQSEKVKEVRPDWWNSYDDLSFQHLYTWKRTLTLRSLSDHFDCYLNPSTGRTWTVCNDSGIFLPVAFLSRKTVLIKEPMYRYRHHPDNDLFRVGEPELVLTVKTMLEYWKRKAESV